MINRKSLSEQIVVHINLFIYLFGTMFTTSESTDLILS